MKTSAIRIERILEEFEARLIPPPRPGLCIITHEGDDEAEVKEKKEKALAEHVARHPEDAGRHG
jgi:tRNA(Ser,Leu) C12 N-acetylase TAN1